MMLLSHSRRVHSFASYAWTVNAHQLSKQTEKLYFFTPDQDEGSEWLKGLINMGLFDGFMTFKLKVQPPRLVIPPPTHCNDKSPREIMSSLWRNSFARLRIVFSSSLPSSYLNWMASYASWFERTMKPINKQRVAPHKSKIINIMALWSCNRSFFFRLWAIDTVRLLDWSIATGFSIMFN